MGCKYCDTRFKETGSVLNEDIVISIRRHEYYPQITVVNEEKGTGTYWYASYCPNCGDSLHKPYPDGKY